MRKRTDEKQKMKKETRGITLIALVVTIVVLLILAGVSINLVIGNNGIISKSKEARIVTRADNAEDEVELWKSNNFIAKNSNGSSESENDMLQRLIDKKLVNEDEIDRNNEIITIKREDGTIVKEINYGGVVIHISKTPETEEAGMVTLQVSSVEGINNIQPTEEGFVNTLNELDKESQRDLIKRIMIADCNNDDSSTNDVNDFSEIVKDYYEEGIIKENTEDAFWKWMDEKLEQSNENYIDFIMQNLGIMFEYILKLDENNQQIIRYEIHNPDNELSDTYLATENGTYTFTVNDLLTGKTYTKSVEVTNIDKMLQPCTVIQVDKNVKLLEFYTNTPTTFSQAYIIYNGESIDITSLIEEWEENTYTYIYAWNIRSYLENMGATSNLDDMTIPIILLKDGVQHEGNVTLPSPE